MNQGWAETLYEIVNKVNNSFLSSGTHDFMGPVTCKVQWSIDVRNRHRWQGSIDVKNRQDCQESIDVKNRQGWQGSIDVKNGWLYMETGQPNL